MNNSTVNSMPAEASTVPTDGLINSLTIWIHYINVLLGFPTHSYVVWLIVTGTKSGVGLPLFNLNLSVCEIGKCLNSLFALVTYYNEVLGLTILAEFLVGLAITGRPLFQCLMCVERYLAVVHPVTFLKYKPLRYRVICCAVAWIITILSCVVCTITITLFYLVYTWFFLIQLLLYFSITLFCCLAVLRALKQSGPRERKRNKEEENNIKRKAFFLFQIATVNMIFIYVPFSISGLSFIVTRHYIIELFTLSFILNVLASFVPPVFFLRQAGKQLPHCFY